MKLCRHCKVREGTINDCTNRDFLKKTNKLVERKYFTCRPCNTARMKAYRATKVGGENVRRAVYKSIKKYKGRQDARVKLNQAVKAGVIVRPKRCRGCLAVGVVQGHHENYSKPLEVLWLCRGCHSTAHRERVI